MHFGGGLSGTGSCGGRATGKLQALCAIYLDRGTGLHHSRPWIPRVSGVQASALASCLQDSTFPTFFPSLQGSDISTEMSVPVADRQMAEPHGQDPRPIGFAPPVSTTTGGSWSTPRRARLACTRCRRQKLRVCRHNMPVLIPSP